MEQSIRLNGYCSDVAKTSKTEKRSLRADAEQNRLKIIDAAQTLFRDRGFDVTMEEVARQAGVGIATLYRRFPNREELVGHAFESKMWKFADGARRALDDPDPWHGFCSYIEMLTAMQSKDRGFSDALTLTFPSVARFEAAREQAFNDFATLVKKAKTSGSLRDDFSPEDLPILLMANAGVLAATGELAPRSSPRLVAYLLQAFAAPGSAALPPAPTTRQMFRAVARLTSSSDGRE
jgi:AcrR family transcriptional regulator